MKRFLRVLGITLGVLLALAIIILLIVTPILVVRHGTSSWLEEWANWLALAKGQSTAFISFKL